MAWLRREQGADGVVTTVDAWLNHQLAGAFVTDAATASRTLLLDLERVAWSDEAVSCSASTPTAQPEIVDCDAPVGEITAFGGRLPLTGLAVDQQAALFAESCFEPGEAKCTYGTGAFILATAGERVVHSQSRLAACVAWRLGGRTTYCLDGQVYSAGSAVSWLQGLELISEAADLDRLDGETGGVLFVPSLAGLGAPFWAPEALGAWLGLSLATRREHLVRRAGLGHRRPGGGPGPGDGRRPRAAARAAAGGRRADALGGPDAGAGRPPPGSGRASTRRRTPPRWARAHLPGSGVAQPPRPTRPSAPGPRAPCSSRGSARPRPRSAWPPGTRPRSPWPSCARHGR